MKQKKTIPVTIPIAGQRSPEIWENELPDKMKPYLPDLMKGLLVEPFGRPGRALEWLFKQINERERSTLNS